MQRLLISAVAIGALAVSSQAQCFEQNFGVLAPLAGGTAGFGDDVAFDEQPLGFPITFGANVYTHTVITENGMMYLTTGGGTNGPTGPGTAYQDIAVALGTTAGDDPRIAPLFMDFWSQPGVSGGVWINTSISGKFIVTWERMVEWWATTQPGPDPLYTFQAQIDSSGTIQFYFDGNVTGTANAGQNDPRTIVSRGDGVVDPGTSDLSALPQNLSDFVIYEAFPAYAPPATSPFDLNDQTVQFVNAGTGYITVSQPCTPALHELYGQGCYDTSDTFYEELSPTAMDLDGSIINGLSLGGSSGSGYLITTTPGNGNIAPGPNATILGLGDDDFQDSGGSLGVWVGSNCNIALQGANSNGFTPSVTTMLNQQFEGLYAWTDLHSTSGGGGGDIYYEESGTVATVTYLGVHGWNTGVPNTVQFVWDTATGNFSIEFENLNTTNPAVWLVGHSPAGASVDGGAVDISALNAAVVSANNAPALSLDASGAPISTATSGSTVTYTIDNVAPFAPGLGIGLVAISFTQTNPGLPLAFLGAPGCSAYVGSLDVTLAVVGAGNSLSTTFNIPAGAPSGTELFAQGINLVQPNSLPNGQNSFGMQLSNGVRSFVSAF
ncbi:MAG: hypothetical protein VXY92_05500 [Planctomycetota bacterium]|nr:hypothetical protein [Planctomycetota bacterium]